MRQLVAPAWRGTAIALGVALVVVLVVLALRPAPVGLPCATCLELMHDHDAELVYLDRDVPGWTVDEVRALHARHLGENDHVDRNGP